MDTHAAPYSYSLFARGILGGLFVGIGTTIVNLIFEFGYRKVTGYDYAGFVNINTIFFYSILAMIIAGLIYWSLVRNVKGGKLMYVIACIVITVLLARIPAGTYMLPSNEPMPSSARMLTVGIEVITGAIAAFVLPYFIEHPKIWGE